MEEWISIEDWLVSQAELKIPVWFALENHQTEALYGTLQSMQDQTTLVVESPEPKEIKKPEISNIQGLLTGLTIGESASHDNRETNSGDITSIPTIAITAYWDSFSSAPGLAYGANSGATGSIALFHIARVLSKLYSNARTQARYNVVFLLSSGSHLNYAGTRHWIDSSATGSAVRESLAWVLCLDGIGLDGELILHASRPAKDPNAARIYNTFTNVAERNQIPFSISHRKINIAEASSSWEHEVFARRKILAVTLSQHSKPAERVGIFDRKRNINLETFTRNLMFVTEVVTRLLYHQDDSDPTIIATANATLTSNWLDSLSAIPRMVPYVDAQHPILDYLEHNLKQFAPDVSRQNFKPDSEKVFYTALSATLTSYRTQPFTFDLSILVAVLVFNAAIYTGLKGDIAAAIADFASLLVWVKGKFSSAAAPTTEGKKSKRN